VVAALAAKASSAPNSPVTARADSPSRSLAVAPKQPADAPKETPKESATKVIAAGLKLPMPGMGGPLRNRSATASAGSGPPRPDFAAGGPPRAADTSAIPSRLKPSPLVRHESDPGASTGSEDGGAGRSPLAVSDGGARKRPISMALEGILGRGGPPGAPAAPKPTPTSSVEPAGENGPKLSHLTKDRVKGASGRRPPNRANRASTISTVTVRKPAGAPPAAPPPSAPAGTAAAADTPAPESEASATAALAEESPFENVAAEPAAETAPDTATEATDEATAAATESSTGANDA
jgi:hypothetical protein